MAPITNFGQIKWIHFLRWIHFLTFKLQLPPLHTFASIRKRVSPKQQGNWQLRTPSLRKIAASSTAFLDFSFFLHLLISRLFTCDIKNRNTHVITSSFYSGKTMRTFPYSDFSKKFMMSILMIIKRQPFRPQQFPCVFSSEKPVDGKANDAV